MDAPARAALAGALGGAALALLYVTLRERRDAAAAAAAAEEEEAEEAEGNAAERLPPRGARRAAAPVASKGVLRAGKVAVITGAANGIGRAVALRCAALRMRLLLADLSPEELERVRRECIAGGASTEHVMVQRTDVSREVEVLALREVAYRQFGRVHLLLNNAGIGNYGGSSAVDGDIERWRQTLAVNFWGVLYGCQFFGERMLAQGEPGVIVNTGSKQGITCPPGDTAYNASKAAVKVLTEGLQHTLRSVPSYDSAPINAFFLVPGWTVSMIGTKAKQRALGDAFDASSAQDEQSYDGNRDPEFITQMFAERGAWTADQVAAELFGAIEAGGPFYILCEDNETTTEMDNFRIQWAADDIIFRRAPLSRWADEHRVEYQEKAAALPPPLR